MAGSGGMGEGDRPMCRAEWAGDGAAELLNELLREMGRSLGGNIEGVLAMDIVGVGGATGMLVVGWRGIVLVLGVATVLDAGTGAGPWPLVAAIYAAS